MLLFLNHVLTQRTEYAERKQTYVPKQGRRWSTCWVICPGCFWVAYVPHDEAYLRCQRPPEAPHITFSKQERLCSQPVQILNELAPRVADTLSSLLRLGGTNSVIKLLQGLYPIEVGLDHPAIGVAPRPFEELRPGSVRKE